MTKGGYGFHSIWFGLPHYLKKMDVEAIKKKAKLCTQPDNLDQ